MRKIWRGRTMVLFEIDGMSQLLTDELPELHKPDEPLRPLPCDQWPLWSKALKQFATENDTGIGDTVARMIGDENSAAFEAWYLATFGKSCGCPGRRKQWNLTYPYDVAPDGKSDVKH